MNLDNGGPNNSTSSNIYHLHVELPREYERLCKRNKPKIISRLSKDQFRIQGYRNIDLWADGNLYPYDPLGKSTPPFKDVTSLLQFVGDGYQGLLGYTQRLEAQHSVERLERDTLARENVHLKYTIQQYAQKLCTTTETIKELEKQISALRSKRTVLGYRRREKKLRAIGDLKPKAGGIKKRIHAIRSLIQPEVQAIADKSGIQLSSFLNKKSMETLLQQKKYKNVTQQYVEKFITTNQLEPRQVQSILDEANISNSGYSALFKSLHFKLKNSNVRKSILPNPSTLRSIRKVINEEVLQLLGEPYHIEDTYKSTKGDVVFDSHNNLFYNIEALQCYIVQQFDITESECNGVLKFVIKLDECQIVKERKLERVTITLMNRALDRTITSSNYKWFSVQSENNIFSLGSFEVPSESFEILYWVFHRTQIPTIITEQSNGRQLVVSNVGTFTVEWHLAGDLKTLKCMYNISKGANSKSPCLYCMSSCDVFDKRYWKKAPDRAVLDTRFQPVLDIPLSRVHICTMHALCRIIEKILYLYITFAWTTQPNSDKNISIRQLEKALSDIGLHGGHVKLETDEKRSKDGRTVPKKVSVSGVKARKFLSIPTHHEDTQKDNQATTTQKILQYNRWKAVHNAVVDHADHGRARSRKADVWKYLDIVFKYCDKRQWFAADHNAFQNALDNFKKSMISAWTQQHITHYMHIIYNHTPWFAKKYGSLSIWSTQGMEKTHYQARTGYFKHTRHGGGITKANSLLELHQWTYRKLVHKAHNKKMLAESRMVQAVRQMQRQRKRTIWQNSDAMAKHLEWRMTRQRDGKIWKPVQTQYLSHEQRSVTM